MFLVERLPREVSRNVAAEEIGYVPRLVKEIERRLKAGLQKPWVPSGALFEGGRDCGEFYLQQSLGCSKPLRTENLSIPRTQDACSDGELKFIV